MKFNNSDNIKYNSILPCKAYSNSSVKGSMPINIVNGFGIDENDNHDNNANALNMWQGTFQKEGENSITFDFEGIFPVGKMLVWNYNQKDHTNYGIKKCKLYYSIDDIDYTLIGEYELNEAGGCEKLQPTDEFCNLGGVSARYIKMVVEDHDQDIFGLSSVRFYAGEGIMVVHDDAWTDLFRCYEGWTGADGIFSIPFNHVETPENFDTKNLFIFSDTFIGNVDRETFKRTFTMVNNTLGILKDGTPSKDNIEFIYRTNQEGKHGTCFDPAGEDHYALEYQNYFWLQDGIIIKDTLYMTALNVYHDPDGPEGLLFGIGDVTMIKCKMTKDGPLWEDYELIDTPLACDMEVGRVFIGCGIFPNTKEAGMKNADGYIYVYGYNALGTRSDLVVSRVKPDDFEDFTKWEYFTGEQWSNEIKDIKVVCENVSHELSVNYMSDGINKGKYVLMFTKFISSPTVAYRIGDSPYGPFGEMVPIYHCMEPEIGYAVNTYNAKAHPHLSKNGELLVSYNVNTLSMETHHKNGDVYRPRFIKLVEIQK